MRREHSSLKDDGRDTCFTNPIFHAEQGSRRMLEGTIWRPFLPSQHWTRRTQPPVPLRQLPIKMALTNCSGGWSAKPTGLGGTSHPWIGFAWHYLTNLTHRSPTQGASRVPRRDRHETIFRNGEIILKPTAVYQEGLVLAYRVSSMVEVVAALLGLCSAGIFLAHAVEAYSTR